MNYKLYHATQAIRRGGLIGWACKEYYPPATTYRPKKTQGPRRGNTGGSSAKTKFIISITLDPSIIWFIYFDPKYQNKSTSSRFSSIVNSPIFVCLRSYSTGVQMPRKGLLYHTMKSRLIMTLTRIVKVNTDQKFGCLPPASLYFHCSLKRLCCSARSSFWPIIQSFPLHKRFQFQSSEMLILPSTITTQVGSLQIFQHRHQSWPHKFNIVATPIGVTKVPARTFNIERR